MELPQLGHRNLTSLQFLDGCRRITTGLLEGMTPIPPSDLLLREQAADCASAAEELARRLNLDRKSDFTQDKKLANAKRLSFFRAVRREVKTVLRSPDPAVTDGQKAAAQEVLAVLDKHVIPARRRSQAEVSSAVQGLLADTASKEMQCALAAIGLSRLVDLLKMAQDEYAAIVRKEDEAAKDRGERMAGSSSDAPVKPRSVRDLKDALNADLVLLFQMMAYQARKGRKPYAALLAQCREITAELNQVAKNRETREKKAEAKREKKEPVGVTTGADHGKTRPNREQPAAPRTEAAPVAAQNGADSALAG